MKKVQSNGSNQINKSHIQISIKSISSLINPNKIPFGSSGDLFVFIGSILMELQLLFSSMNYQKLDGLYVYIND